MHKMTSAQEELRAKRKRKHEPCRETKQQGHKRHPQQQPTYRKKTVFSFTTKQKAGLNERDQPRRHKCDQQPQIFEPVAWMWERMKLGDYRVQYAGVQKRLAKR